MKRCYSLWLLMLICVSGSLQFSRADDVVIENRDKRMFYYSLRDSADVAWSKTHEIAPGEKQTHATSNRVRISYLTDVAHYAWLEARKTYRIDNVAQGRLRAVTQVRRPALPDATTNIDDETPAPRDDSASPAPPATATAAEPDRAATVSQPKPTRTPSIAAPTLDPAGNDARTEESFEALFDVTNRVVTVRAIADNTYRDAFPEWRERIRRIVASASEYYRREYSIRLVLTETSAWKYDGVAVDLKSRWARLLEQSPNEVDLIVALVGYGDYSSVNGEAAFTGQLGRAAFFGQHLMVADRNDYHENRAKTILLHELGHIFGAFHVADQNLMMYPGYLQLPTDEIIAGTVPFGDTIDQIFAMTKEFDFRTGVNSLSPVTQRRIQSLYRLHGLPQESRQTDPITDGYKYLERRAQIVAEQMAERAETSRGVFDGLPE
ncbi:MAG TPA: M12 family metallo-peptidase [Pirellulaceae bacterium]|nr:M12 family metallo-peptidase [Pirellulaceae bacterium]